jgi:hypothetical protein
MRGAPRAEVDVDYVLEQLNKGYKLKDIAAELGVRTSDRNLSMQVQAPLHLTSNCSCSMPAISYFRAGPY